MGYFLDMMRGEGMALILILPLLAFIFVVVLVIVIIYKIASSNKTGNMDPNVSPEDWAEKRNEEKGIDN